MSRDLDIPSSPTHSAYSELDCGGSPTRPASPRLGAAIATNPAPPPQTSVASAAYVSGMLQACVEYSCLKLTRLWRVCLFDASVLCANGSFRTATEACVCCSDIAAQRVARLIAEAKARAGLCGQASVTITIPKPVALERPGAEFAIGRADALTATRVVVEDEEMQLPTAEEIVAAAQHNFRRGACRRFTV
jgi:hypothetical protein